MRSEREDERKVRFRSEPNRNMAAIREALVKLRTEVERFSANGWIPYDAWQGCDEMIGNALSAPARNCDVLSADQCKKIFKKEMGIYLPQEATDRDREIARCTAYGVIDALFAPSTETEGVSDGK